MIELIGRDPFRASAPLRLEVSVARRGGELTGTIVLRDETGRILWINDKLQDPNDCATVVRAMAVVLAIELDDWPKPPRVEAPPAPGAACAAPKSEPASPGCATPAPCPDSRFSVWPTEWPLLALEKPRPDPPKPPERWPIAVRLGIAAWPELVAKGWGSFGLSAAAARRSIAASTRAPSSA